MFVLFSGRKITLKHDSLGSTRTGPLIIWEIKFVYALLYILDSYSGCYSIRASKIRFVYYFNFGGKVGIVFHLAIKGDVHQLSGGEKNGC